ncbi:hypothetical protein ACWEKU_27710 [Streptomyces californicus]
MVSTPARDTTPDAARDPDGRPYADAFRPATLDWDGWTCADCIVCATGRQCADCRACTNFALPYPPHWAQAWTEGHPERGIEAFGGPGGMSAGRALVDDSGDWVLIEFNRDAAATARAAGHWVVEADIRTLDPPPPGPAARPPLPRLPAVPDPLRRGQAQRMEHRRDRRTPVRHVAGVRGLRLPGGR